MAKSKLVAIVVYVIVAAAFTFVAMNSHLDIYPCEISEYRYTPREGYGPRHSATCSLLTIQRSDEGPHADKASLTVAGWLVLLLVHGLVVPLPLALGAAWLVKRKSA